MNSKRGDLVFIDYSIRYPNFVIEPLSMTIASGEMVFLVGANGAGKSTLLKSIAGFCNIYHGHIRFQGNDIRSHLPGIREKIGFLPERLLAFPKLRVKEHLLLLSNMYSTWDPELALELTKQLKVPLDEKILVLSKGTRTKLGLIAAIAFRPSLLVLDEPTSGIDPSSRAAILSAVSKVHSDNRDQVTLIATHLLEDLDEVMAGRLLVIRNGSIVLDTPLLKWRSEREYWMRDTRTLLMGTDESNG